MDNIPTNTLDLIKETTSYNALEEEITPPFKEFAFTAFDEKGEENEGKFKTKDKNNKKDPKDIFDLASQSPPVAMPSPLPSFRNEVSSVQVAGIAGSPIVYNEMMLEMFEKVALMSTHLHESGDSETTILLDSSNPSSIFQGAEIVISEYSTAPKIFNVQINACAEAVALLQGQTNELINFVHEKRAPFQIGRVTAGLKEERMQKRRVEGVLSQDKQSLSDGNL